ncbi:hypothetical protein L873DRAFT_1683177, partial [Choiromyces venosus 120613-1]
GRPLSIDTPTMKQLVATAMMSSAHRQMPLTEVAAACGITACEKTLLKAFRSEGYSHRVACKKPLLGEMQKASRLIFALAHQHWIVGD